MCLLPLCCTFFCYGVEVDSTKLYDIGHVDITAHQENSAVQSSVPLQISTQNDFIRYGLNELSDVLNFFSGVTVKDYGGVGGLKTVSVRNLGAQHTVISYDGIAINNVQGGQVDIGRFGLNSIEQVSLTIGLSDNIFLPARMMASAAMLTFSTRRRNFADSQYGGQVQLKAGSFGLIQPSFLYTQKINSIVSFSVFGDFLKSKGEYPFILKNGKEIESLKRLNNEILSSRLESNLYLKFSQSHTWDHKIYGFWSDRGLPGSVVLYNPYAAERLEDRNIFYQSTYSKQISDYLSIKVLGKYDHTYNRYTNKRPEQETLVDDRYNQQEYYLSTVLFYKPLRCLSFSVAQDATYTLLDSNLDSPFEKFAFPRRHALQTSLSGQYKIPQLTITANVLGSYAAETVRNGEPADDIKKINPAISLSYKPLFWHELYFRAGYKDIFRAPTFNERYYTAIGNRKLRTENTKQVNVGVSYSTKINETVRRIFIQTDGYYNNVTDKLVALPTMFIWSMMNLGKVAIWGIDINVNSEYSIMQEVMLVISSNYSYQKAIDVTSQDAKNYQHQIPYTPRHSGNVAFAFEHRWINFSYTLIACGDRYALPQNIPSNLIEPYIDHAISINRTFSVLRCKLRLQLDFLNLSNKNYEVIQYYPMPGRSFRASVHINF